ncbi:MAG TPA: trehalose-phosphatase [Acidimicrobiales bacterium]|nr:trehalose-phosphatase [Acidimicrobiales bacterium]
MRPPSKQVDWSPWAHRPGEAGVICDYDGTLAAIVDDPSTAKPLPGAREALVALSGQLALVAVISGRPLGHLEPAFAPDGRFLLVGLYGMERLGPRSQGLVVDERALAWQGTVARAADDAEAHAPPGLDIERKGLSVVLHARRHPEVFPWALEWASARAGSTGLVAQAGRLSVELLPPVPIDKGTVVAQLSEDLEAVCYLGDDTGDLPAFAALRRMRARGKHTVSVGVSSPEQPAGLAGAVDILVDGPPGALALLEGLSRVSAS